jgi:hypothetical protein
MTKQLRNKYISLTVKDSSSSLKQLPLCHSYYCAHHLYTIDTIAYCGDTMLLTNKLLLILMLQLQYNICFAHIILYIYSNVELFVFVIDILTSTGPS